MDRSVASLGMLLVAVAIAPASVAAQAARDAERDSTFVLTTDDPARGPSPFIGNGRVGLVIPALGLAAERSFVAGLYEHGPGDVPRIVSIPAWNGIRVFDGERWLADTLSARDSIQAYRQTIDMRTGTASTRYERVTGARRMAIGVETFVSRATPHLAAIRLELVPHQAGRMRVRFALAGWPPPSRLPLDTLKRTEPSWGPAELWYPGHVVVRSRAASVRPGAASLSLTSTPMGRASILAEAAMVSWPADLPGVRARTPPARRSATVEIAFDATAGTTYRFTQLVGIVSSAETANPLAVASRSVQEAGVRGYDGLATANADAWARRWQTDIVLDGDPALQRVVRAMLFYLLCSADAGTAMGIPPMGLSSGGYYGHVFWDSDTWMFPALLLTHPDVARSLVSFRFRTFSAARANARSNGFRGAMYPWEADERGVETTPHFAAQNASSEIHVNGDVALAQWQHYLATGDSAWLAREGFPVIRGTADFWVSRASYDSASGRYHIRNVVSVAEGLQGVSDDAYTNAVARRNLEFAVAAAGRLGVPADPRWTAVAEKLHMPIDSASGFFRTYEGAPDSTLGVVTPLLAYPLGVAMSDTSKRAHLDQAVRRLAEEAAGAMMGITLLSVDAAELGDRRLVDSLLPFSYRYHLKGPFLLPSETPVNNAVSFVTGAGGFLQQVIFGYTGLRIGERGLEPAFPPVLPSRVRRLVLRNLSVRGRRVDVVVDSTGRHVVEQELSAQGSSRPAQPPVLAFPEPGVDDTTVYQGYRTRFYRDSRGNTVQIYLEPRAARVVHLLADAADESVAFTVRDAAGRPARLDWADEGAAAGDSGAARTLEWHLAVAAPRVTVGWFLLGSMRVERDFQYAKAQARPFSAPSYFVAEESLLVANVGRLPPEERKRHLELLGANTVATLRSRLLPTLAGGCAARCTARVERTSLDGQNHLSLELSADPGETVMRVVGRTVQFRSRTGAPVRLTVRIATDGASLTPLPRDSIFNRTFLDFLDREGGRDSTVAGRRLEREVRSVELLSSEQKLMAGLPNFATYFGRDMLMAALMMRPIWRPEMSEHVIASVLRKLSPRGDVSHEEALGGQAIRENAGEYNELMAAYFRAARAAVPEADGIGTAACDTTLIPSDGRVIPSDGRVIPTTGRVIPSAGRVIPSAGRVIPSAGRVIPSAGRVIPSEARDLLHRSGTPVKSGDVRARSLASLGMTPRLGMTPGCILLRARTLLSSLQRTRENYHMLDDEFQLPVLEARYLADATVPPDRKRAFLLAAEGDGPPRLALMLRELALVAAETRPYAADPAPANLVSFVKRDSSHWRSASWRDSDAGYGNGRYAMDINAIWAPRALEAIASIVAALPTIGIDRRQLDSMAPEAMRGPLGEYLAEPTLLRRAIQTWRGARGHFVVTLSRAEIERGVAAKLGWLPPPERAYWRKVMADQDEVRGSLTFMALSLDSAARPLALVNSDPATEMFLDATSSSPVALDQLEAFLRPYPVGLFVDQLGPLATNDAYGPRRVWDAFAKDPYHGPRVVWGREVNLLLLGLASAVGRAPEPRASDALRRTLRAVRASGLEYSELWSYRIEGGRLQPTRYGTSSDVQLWSSTDLAVQFVLSRLPHE